MVEVAPLCASMSRMEAMLQKMNEILDRFSGGPDAATHPTTTSSSTQTEFADTSGGTQAAGTAAFFPAEAATDDVAPLPLLLADADGVPASGAWAAESFNGVSSAPSSSSTAAVYSSLFTPVASTTAAVSTTTASDVTTAASTTSPVITTLQPATIALAMCSTSMPSMLSTSAMVNDAALRTGTSLISGVPTMCSTSVLDGHYATVVSLLRSTPFRDAPSMTLPATVIACSSEPKTPCCDTQKLFDGIPCHQEIVAACVLHVRVSQVLFPVTVEVVHQVFDPFGAVKVSLIAESACVEAMVVFRSDQDAMRALETCNGRCIWDGCCVMDISRSQLQKVVAPTVLAINSDSTTSYTESTVVVPEIAEDGSFCNMLIDVSSAALLSKSNIHHVEAPIQLVEATSKYIPVAPMQLSSPRIANDIKVDTLALDKSAAEELVNNGNNDHVKLLTSKSDCEVSNKCLIECIDFLPTCCIRDGYSVMDIIQVQPATTENSFVCDGLSTGASPATLAEQLQASSPIPAWGSGNLLKMSNDILN